ncbi:MAG: M23 family metallopeptidase [Kofleriaceae bacterium]
MRSVRRLAAVAVALAAAAAVTPGPTVAPAAATPLAGGPVALMPPSTAQALSLHLAPWLGWLPLPRAVAAVPVELLVSVRDAVADVLERPSALLGLTAPIPDLSILTASPVPGVESSGFGWRRDPFHHRAKFHKGTDFRADRGTPVYAAGAGVVLIAGRQHGYGNVIYVDHGGGVITRYGHLSKIEIRAGDAVAAATLIGRVGATGRATGPHLHFEVRLDGRAVDPTAALHVAELQRTDPAAARLAAWTLLPAVQDQRTDRHDPPRRVRGKRPERRHAPVRDRNRV